MSTDSSSLRVAAGAAAPLRRVLHVALATSVAVVAIAGVSVAVGSGGDAGDGSDRLAAATSSGDDGAPAAAATRAGGGDAARPRGDDAGAAAGAAGEPADERDEPPAEGPPEVTQRGASLDEPPVPEAVFASTPTPEPVGLFPVEGPAPEAGPVAPPAPEAMEPYDATPGDLVSNAPGCASRCIVEALLRKQAVQPDLELDVRTNVNARIHVWIADREPIMAGGVPVFPGQAPTAVSEGFAKEWSTMLGDLLYEKTYNVIVRATDYYGNKQYATTAVTTVAPPGPADLTGAGSGCYYQCIATGHVVFGDSYATVDLVATTKTNATFSVAVSKQAPGTIGGDPLLPADEAFEINQLNPRAFRGTVSGLAADTVYNVLVRATDADGNTAHALGSFRTKPLPPRVPGPTNVLIVFERVEILYDGDANPGNRGDIELVWGLSDGSYFGQRSQDKLSDGDVVTLPAGSGRWIAVPPGGKMPKLVVNAVEEDYRAGIGRNRCMSGMGLSEFPSYNETCEETRNVAKTDAQPVTWIDSLGKCRAFGFTGPKGDDMCMGLRAAEMGGGDFVDFWAVVSFHRQ